MYLRVGEKYKKKRGCSSLEGNCPWFLEIEINGVGSRGTARGERPYDDPIRSCLGRDNRENRRQC